MPHKDPEVRRAYQRAWERRHYAQNADTIRAKKKVWRDNNRDKQYQYDRKCKLMREYGLTVEKYDALDEAQNHVCKICRGVNPDGSRLAVDHDHTNGQVRGLLCINCNKGLGHFKDNAELLQEAARYIQSQRDRKEGIAHVGHS